MCLLGWSVEPSSLGESTVGEVKKEEDTDLLLPGALGELGKNLPVKGAVLSRITKSSCIYMLILEVHVLKEFTQCVDLPRWK